MASSDGYGFIDDTRTYTFTELARCFGVSRKTIERKVREFHVPHADLGGGMKQISGRTWRFHIERLAGEQELDGTEAEDQPDE